MPPKGHPAKTIYVRDARLWAVATEVAKLEDVSLSRIVELALKHYIKTYHVDTPYSLQHGT